MNSSDLGSHNFVQRWVVASTIGWLAGFVLVVLLAMAIEFFAGGVQVVVGVGVGAGTGFFQGRVLSRWFNTPWLWMRASVIGMGIPFLIQDLGTVIGLSLPSSLWIYVPIGGLLVAVLQRNLLRGISVTPGRWVIPCVAGWALPAVVIAVGDGLLGLGMLGGILSLGGMLLGGAMFGAVTGKPLKSLLPWGSV